MLLHLADKRPTILAKPFQEPLRGVPRLEQDKAGLEREPMAGRTAPRQRPIERGRAAFLPDPAGKREAELPMRPDQQHHRNPKDALPAFARPARGGFLKPGGLRFFTDRIVHDEVASQHREQRAQSEVPECVPGPRPHEPPCQPVVGSVWARLSDRSTRRDLGHIQQCHQRCPKWLWHRISPPPVGSMPSISRLFRRAYLQV